MLSVASLLNPLPENEDEDRSSPANNLPSHVSTIEHSNRSTPVSVDQPTDSRSPPYSKKPKMVKDGASFIKSKTRGEIVYPPFEDVDRDLKEQMRRWSVFPLGKITSYARHIPYNSEKKGFPRESFEVFQYTFRVPGEETEYTVMWDYNVGLVRITPFFKCCRYSKTTPGKMLKSNGDLHKVCHSITGGALAAQGYWMPYEAAKAVAATFCHPMRYALIPVFGPDFVDLCTQPEDPAFGRMVIDQALVQSCIDNVHHRREPSEVPTFSSESFSSSSAHTSPSNQVPRKTEWTYKPGLRCRTKRLDRYVESGYGTDTDSSDKLAASPSTPAQEIGSSVQHQTPRSVIEGLDRLACSRSTTPASGTVSAGAKRRLSEVGEEESSDDGASTSSSGESTASLPQMDVLSEERQAACLLMQMRMGDRALTDVHLSKRRRASL